MTPKGQPSNPDLVTVTVARDVYECIRLHQRAMIAELGQNITLRVATEALVLAGYDNTP